MKKTYRKNLKGQNVLIIGGSGFIGSHLAEELIEKKVKRLVIVDNLSVGKKNNLKRIFNKIVFIKKNAENFDLTESVIKKYKINIVFNLATIALPFSFKFPRKTFETNTLIILNLLELLRQKKFSTLCHFSTSEVYGSAKIIPMSENHALNPTTTYASGKLAADKALESYNKMFGLDCFIVRPFNNYGPRQPILIEEIGIIPKTIKRIYQKKSPVIYGSGKQKRDFIFVKDTCKYILTAYSKIKPGDQINISANNPIQIKKLIDKIILYTKSNKKIIYKKERPADVFIHHGDNKKLKALVKIKKDNFEKNLLETISYYLNFLKNGF